MGEKIDNLLLKLGRVSVAGYERHGHHVKGYVRMTDQELLSAFDKNVRNSSGTDDYGKEYLSKLPDEHLQALTAARTRANTQGNYGMSGQVDLHNMTSELRNRTGQRGAGTHEGVHHLGQAFPPGFKPQNLSLKFPRN